MAEENKSPTILNLEREVPSEIGLEIPPVINRPAPMSNNRQLEEPKEDTKVEDAPRNMDTLQTSLLVPTPSNQDRRSLPTYLGLQIKESQNRRSLPTSSIIPMSIDQDVQSLPTGIISIAEVSLSAVTSKSEKAGTSAEVSQMTERPSKSVSSSNTEKPEKTLQDTSPKLIENLIQTEITDPDSSFFLPISQQSLVIQTDTTIDPSSSTSKSESPQKMDQYHELVNQIQRLGLEVTEKSSEDSPNDPFEKHQISSQRYKDQTWDLPCRERKTGLISVWNEPDEDFVPYLGIKKAMLGKSKKSGGSVQGVLSKFRCPQCQRPILGDSSITCQKCVEENEGALGACGGVHLNPQPFVEGETSPPTEEESSSSDDNFKKPIERMSSFERYVYMRHLQREDEAKLQEATLVFNQQFEDSYSSLERSDLEEHHRRMLRQEILGPRPASQEEISYVMSQRESAIFEALSRPGETVEDLRNPENELREIEHYDRCMAKLNAELLKKDEESDCESEETEYSEESVPSESTTSTSTD